jgi:hypothetical protein
MSPECVRVGMTCGDDIVCANFPKIGSQLQNLNMDGRRFRFMEFSGLQTLHQISLFVLGFHLVNGQLIEMVEIRILVLKFVFAH